MDLYKLIKLQDMDKRIMELESFKGDLPEQVENLKDKLAHLNNNLTKSKTELEETKKQNRSLGVDIHTFTEKLSKYQEQLYAVKTNKEYDAITLEIETLEQKIGEAEINSVETLEQDEKLTAEVAELEKQVLELNQFLREKEFELQEKLNQTEAEQNVLSSQRNELIITVDRRLLATYERIRKGKKGIALAEIHNYTCDACYATIPAQTVVEVRKMDRVIHCETCGRLLVATNNHAEDTIKVNSNNIPDTEKR